MPTTDTEKGGGAVERESITRSSTFRVKITAPAASSANATANTSD